MATTIHYPNESSTIDALWTILNQQSESVKKALAARLKESLSHEKVLPHKSMEEALTKCKILGKILATNNEFWGNILCFLRQ